MQKAWKQLHEKAQEDPFVQCKALPGVRALKWSSLQPGHGQPHPLSFLSSLFWWSHVVTDSHAPDTGFIPSRFSRGKQVVAFYQHWGFQLLPFVVRSDRTSAETLHLGCQSQHLFKEILCTQHMAEEQGPCSMPLTLVCHPKACYFCGDS